MTEDELRTKLRTEIHHTRAEELLPHHRRGGLIVAALDLDLLDAAVSIGLDDTDAVTRLIESGRLTRPTLAELADWCLDTRLKFQFVIVQPFVLAQPMPTPGPSPAIH